MKKIKITIITNGDFVDKYTYDLAKWIKSNNKKFYFKNFITLPKNNKKYSNKNKILKKIFFRLIIFFENLVLKFTKNHKDHFQKFDLKNIVNKKFKIRETKNKSLNQEDLNNIKNENFDILIRSCTNILNEEILKCPKYGIISFHHGDYAKYRGSPAGFWEVFFKEKTTGFIIQKLEKKLDYGKIILEGFLQTKSFFLYNQAELFNKSNFYIKKVLLDFHKNKKFYFIKKREKGKIFETPKIMNQIRYLLETTKILIKKIFYYNNNFNIASFNLKKFNSPIIIKNNSKNFLADPFLIKYKNKNFCFAEEYSHIKKKGHIVCIDLNDKKNEKKIILDEKFHLSFPYIFNYNNKFFMCPDTSSISEIRLYESTNFPFKWKFYKTIKKNINSVDNIIFKNKGLWWLFTNIDQSNTGDFSHDLSIFYTKKNPLTNRWKNHLLNPIKINSLETRNAGIILEKNKMIRISQLQGFDNYGENINFHLIKTLTTKKYKEKLIKNKDFTKIKNKLNNADIHHFSKIKNDVLVDFKSS